MDRPHKCTDTAPVRSHDNLRIHGKRFIGPTGLRKIKTVLQNAWFRSNLPQKKHEFSSNSLLFQIFYAIKIPNFFNFNRGNRIKSNIFGQKLRMDDVFLVYLDQIVSFCAIIHSNTNSVKLSSLNSANFTNNLTEFVFEWIYAKTDNLIQIDDKNIIHGFYSITLF